MPQRVIVCVGVIELGQNGGEPATFSITQRGLVYKQAGPGIQVTQTGAGITCAQAIPDGHGGICGWYQYCPSGHFLSVGIGIFVVVGQINFEIHGALTHSIF